SINFITAHDGFTLADLVSYDSKHNEANGESNADGENHNLSWNCGAEGATTNKRVLELRARQRRNFMATLLFSVGVPMLSGGDEGVTFMLPATAAVERWDTLVDTGDPWLPPRRLRAGDRYDVQGRSMAVMKLSVRKDDLRRTADWGPQGVV